MGKRLLAYDGYEAAGVALGVLGGNRFGRNGKQRKSDRRAPAILDPAQHWNQRIERAYLIRWWMRTS